jgi:hypothetical protein
MGIATTGPRGVVVHEFGHAFPGLLDEYAVNPGEPAGQVEAANATTRPENPPWKHFLDAEIPGVGVYEGGATFQKGVWRPAGSCAMNTGGSQYCPVCREACVLTIYTYVSPIEDARPYLETVEFGDGNRPDISVVPMRPASHDLEVEWWLGTAPAVTTGPAEVETGPGLVGDGEEAGMTPLERRLRERLRRQREDGGSRGSGANAAPLPTPFPFRPGASRRSAGTANDGAPVGRRLRIEKDRGRDGETIVRPVIPPGLAPGRHLLTAVVRDPVKPKGARHPWVIKDERGLLEDRRTWVLVVPEPLAAPPK